VPAAAALTTSTTICTWNHLFTFSSFLILHLITKAEVAVFAGVDRLTCRRCGRRSRHRECHCCSTFTHHCKSKTTSENQQEMAFACCTDCVHVGHETCNNGTSGTTLAATNEEGDELITSTTTMTCTHTPRHGHRQRCSDHRLQQLSKALAMALAGSARHRAEEVCGVNDWDGKLSRDVSCSVHHKLHHEQRPSQH